MVPKQTRGCECKKWMEIKKKNGQKFKSQYAKQNDQGGHSG